MCAAVNLGDLAGVIKRTAAVVFLPYKTPCVRNRQQDHTAWYLHEFVMKKTYSPYPLTLST